MHLTQPADIVDFDPYVADARTAAHELGDMAILTDKRTFRMSKAGASNISKGKLQLAPAPKTNHHNIAVPTAVAADEFAVTVTLGATAAVAGEYNEGWVIVNDNEGEGQEYKISSHPAANSGASLAIKLFDGISTPLTTSSEVSLVHNRFNATVEAAVATRRLAGVPLVNVTATQLFWAKTGGVAGVLADGAVAVGNAIVPSDAVAGAVEQQDVFVNATDATRLDAKSVAGRADIMALVDTEFRPVTLMIDL